MVCALNVPLTRYDRQHDMAGPHGIVEYGLIGHLHLCRRMVVFACVQVARIMWKITGEIIQYLLP